MAFCSGPIASWGGRCWRWIDVLTMRLPDLLTLPLLVVDLLVEALLSPENLLAHIWGAAVGSLSFTIVAIGYRVLRGRDGLGAAMRSDLQSRGLAWLGRVARRGVYRCPSWYCRRDSFTRSRTCHRLNHGFAVWAASCDRVMDRASVRTGDLRFSGRIISCGSGAGISFAVAAAKCRVFRDGAVRICEFA
jgi:hypothetical protein